MWLVSVLVLVPIAYLISGKPIPDLAREQLNRLYPNDVIPSDRFVAIGCLVGVLMASTPLHRIFRYLPTVVHELGHAFTAGVLGGRPRNIKISLDTSGLAEYEPPITWGRFRASLVSLAGYPASPIAAVAAIKAVQGGFSQAWFAFAAGTLAISIVLLIRSFWGFFWTAGAVAASYFGAPLIPMEFIGAIVAGISGYLAVEGMRHAYLQWVIVRKFPGSGADAERIAHWWNLGPPLISLLHLLTVVFVGAYAVKLALGPYWSEILDWVRTVTRVESR